MLLEYKFWVRSSRPASDQIKEKNPVPITKLQLAGGACLYPSYLGSASRQENSAEPVAQLQWWAADRHHTRAGAKSETRLAKKKKKKKKRKEILWPGVVVTCPGPSTLGRLRQQITWVSGVETSQANMVNSPCSSHCICLSARCDGVYTCNPSY